MARACGPCQTVHFIQKEEEGNFIFRIDEDGKAILTPVQLGIRVGHSVQVLKYRKKQAEAGSEAVWSVFNGAETIIMNPSSFVDGMKIEKTKSSTYKHCRGSEDLRPGRYSESGEQSVLALKTVESRIQSMQCQSVRNEH